MSSVVLGKVDGESSEGTAGEGVFGIIVDINKSYAVDRLGELRWWASCFSEDTNMA
jgi:hypothetical protein